MGDTSIEWTDKTWNPIVGCSIVSPGCTNCYAMRMAARLEAMGSVMEFREELGHSINVAKSHYNGLTQPSKAGAVWTGKVARAPEHILTAPWRWKKPCRIFVNSMSDLFHESIPDEWIAEVFAVMEGAPRHTFQVLTKRAARMRRWCSQWNALVYPLPNVWLGVSAEDQTRADERIPDLLATPAAVRFVSAEPLLGQIKMHERLGDDWLASGLSGERKGLDWVIVGGESGKGARPMHPDWARSIRDQCEAAGVPFFFKQWGNWLPFDQGIHLADSHVSYDVFAGCAGYMARAYQINKKLAGRLLDGVEHNGMPR